MKLRLSAVFTALFMSCAVAAQTDFRERFQEYKFSTPALGTVEYCTFRSTINSVKPILLFIHVSGIYPHSIIGQIRKPGSGVDFQNLKNIKTSFISFLFQNPESLFLTRCR
jgi:hypothetical protein